MGYRSDVAYTIRFKKEEDYHLFILEAKANPKTAGCFPPNDGSHFEEVECNDRMLRIDFNAQSVKWYDSYPDVQMHEELIDQADEWVKETTGTLNEYRLGYVFVRIGEDDNDVVRLEGGNNQYDWLYVTRQITEG